MAEKQSNRERLKEITDRIEAGIQEMFQSGNVQKYEAYLRTMGRFHRYSVNNIMLILMQRPDATLVAGYNKWQNQFGRHVMRGEKGITIIAPTPYKKKIEEEKLDPNTQKPMLDENGDVIMEEKEIRIPMFRPTTVFDVAQTEGKPLPERVANPVATLTGDVEHYEVFMEALRRSSPVPIRAGEMDADTDGYFSRTDQEIVYREGMSQIQTVSAVIHEIGHAKLHNYGVQQANVLNAMPDRMTVQQSRLDNLYAQIETAKAELGKPFPQEEELRQKSARLAQLNIELNIDERTPMEQLAEEAPTVAKSSRPSVIEKLRAPLPAQAAVKPKSRELEV